jgi:N-acetylglucosaminyldiphosphoundecaprenol N-acetyl-beta-D-mannosaminyltransferase
MSNQNKLVCERVINFPVAANSFNEQIEIIVRWGHQRLSRVVCVGNVHMLMEAYWDPAFANVLESADMITPDGMPLVWTMNLLRRRPHDRVCGMHILRNVCERASTTGLGVYFLGCEASVLDRMRQRLKQEYPNLKIAGMEPLPFRPLTAEEDRQVVRNINESQAGIVFVALGCPKQEIWMHQHKDKIQAVMAGIGGVFPVYAGLKKHAPNWVQQSGLEWFFRLVQEPGRLWHRYSSTIPPFIYLSARQVITTKVRRKLFQAFSGRSL